MAFGDYQIGSTGTGVSDLQRYLREVGYGVAVDGKYGPETRAAVMAFQQARGIRVDGIAGPETLVSLAQARAERWRAPPMTADQAADAQAPGRAIKPESKFTGLWLLLALAVGAWYLTSGSKRSSGGGGRRFATIEPDDEEDEPEEDDDSDADEDEDDAGED